MGERQKDYGWDDPETAHYYERFCDQHSRYDRANVALLRHARLKPGLRILDFAAGTGRTAEAALPFIGDGTVICVEPALAMREAGRKRLTDPRVVWREALPEEAARYDRILCGAALWQITPLSQIIQRLAVLLSPTGELIFNIPALYLGLPDPPGGGDDPALLMLPAAIAEDNPDGVTRPEQAQSIEALPDMAAIDQLLLEAGLSAERWSYRARFTQASYRDWLKIPVLSNHLLPGLDADSRAKRIDSAYRRVDEASRRWEHWCGWTARAGVRPKI
jgi:SAM-dependent methyltransferase